MCLMSQLINYTSYAFSIMLFLLCILFCLDIPHSEILLGMEFYQKLQLILLSTLLPEMQDINSPKYV